MDALRQPPTPVAPRPAFTADLRRRIEVELGPAPPTASGVAMSDITTPTRAQTVTPYLCARDAAAAIRYYREVFGAREVGDIFVGPDGRVGHAELQVGASTFMIADEYPEEGVLSPATLGGTCVQIRLQVDDVDTVFDRAVAAGAEVLRPVSQQFYGERAGKVRDPFGHNWFITTPVEDVSPEEMQERAGATGFSVTDDIGPGEPI
jgi:PhnB protein